jgi:hypothetical protein
MMQLRRVVGGVLGGGAGRVVGGAAGGAGGAARVRLGAAGACSAAGVETNLARTT